MSVALKLKDMARVLLMVLCLLVLSGCNVWPLRMADQPRYDPLEPSTLFADGTSAQPLPPNTMPRGEWGRTILDDRLYTGKVNGEYAERIPLTVDRAFLLRGQERFNIFCSPCHGRVGDGQGMIVQRGFPQPPSFHTDRLRQQPVGYFYDVISNGFGVMYSYASRIPPQDRWAIVAYIRALQLSQNATLDNVPADARDKLEAQ
jgi:hypothetical protein